MGHDTARLLMVVVTSKTPSLTSGLTECTTRLWMTVDLEENAKGEHAPGVLRSHALGKCGFTSMTVKTRLPACTSSTLPVGFR